MNGKDRRSTNDAFEEHYEDMLDDGMKRKMANDERAYSGKVEDINRGKYADLSSFESRGHRRISPEKMRAIRRARILRRALPAALVSVVLIIALTVYFAAVRPASSYKKALSEFDKGNYIASSDIFSRLSSYKQSEKYLAYIKAAESERDGDYQTAADAFSHLGDFLDSADRVKALAANVDKSEEYARAGQLFDAGDYDGAAKAYEALGDYSDAREKAKRAKNESTYAKALAAENKGQKQNAAELYRSLGSFRDSAERLARLEGGSPEPTSPTVNASQLYKDARAEMSWGNFDKALEGFTAAGDYLDSQSYALYCSGKIKAAAGDNAGAAKCFEDCTEILDAADLAKEYKYNSALECIKRGEYGTAIEMLDALGDYSDAREKAEAARNEYNRSRYEDAVYAYYDGRKEEALTLFEALGDYSDARNWAEKCRNEIN